MPTELQLKFFAFEFKADKNASGIHTQSISVYTLPIQKPYEWKQVMHNLLLGLFLSSPKLETFIYLQSKDYHSHSPKKIPPQYLAIWVLIEAGSKSTIFQKSDFSIVYLLHQKLNHKMQLGETSSLSSFVNAIHMTKIQFWGQTSKPMNRDPSWK